MSKYSLCLLATIVVLGIVLLSSCSGGVQPEPKPVLPKPIPAPTPPPSPTSEKSKPTTIPTPSPPEQTMVEDAVTACIVVNQLEQSRDQELNIEVWIYPGPYGISAGEVSISFDPSYVSVIDIQPGELFGSNPIVGIKSVDNEQGTITYAVARTGPTIRPTTSGVFASVKMKVFKTGNGTYGLKITEIGLSDENFEDIQNIIVTDIEHIYIRE